jgi:hypothetical protein
MTNFENFDKMEREHHVHHYNREKFEWVWGTIDHLGIWAFGGENKKVAPSFKNACFCVPPAPDKKISLWLCYLGPEPLFAPAFSIEKYNEWIKSLTSPLPPNLRRGQWMFVELNREMPLIAHEIWGDDQLDAFYVDGNIDKMVEYVKSRCETTQA